MQGKLDTVSGSLIIVRTKGVPRIWSLHSTDALLSVPICDTTQSTYFMKEATCTMQNNIQGVWDYPWNKRDDCGNLRRIRSGRG